MTSGERIGSADLDRLTALDALRWSLALGVVTAGGLGAAWLLQTSTPATPLVQAAEPAMLIDLAPLPPEPVVEPAPVEEAEPVAEPPPEVVPPPEPPPTVEEPLPEPEPIVEEPPPEPEVAEEPPPPPEPEVVEPPPPPEPEPEVVEPPPEPEPEPEPVVEDEVEPEVSPDLPMPMTMSPKLQQRRAETPPTPRPQQQQPRPQPAAQAQPRPQPSAPAPSAPASTVSPQQWQQQALSRIDSRKVYPRASQAAGEEGVVVISFSVSASGQIASVGIARSSGYAALDQAAIETARRASPLPAPPAGIAGQPLTANIRFSLR